MYSQRLAATMLRASLLWIKCLPASNARSGFQALDNEPRSNLNGRPAAF